MGAARQVLHAGEPAQIAQAKDVLRDTRRNLYRILAEDAPEGQASPSRSRHVPFSRAIALEEAGNEGPVNPRVWPLLRGQGRNARCQVRNNGVWPATCGPDPCSHATVPGMLDALADRLACWPSLVVRPSRTS